MIFFIEVLRGLERLGEDFDDCRHRVDRKVY
jgi:hypothetical protein